MVVKGQINLLYSRCSWVMLSNSKEFNVFVPEEMKSFEPDPFKQK